MRALSTALSYVWSHAMAHAGQFADPGIVPPCAARNPAGPVTCVFALYDPIWFASAPFCGCTYWASPGARAVPDEIAAMLLPFLGVTLGPYDSRTPTCTLLSAGSGVVSSASRSFALMTPHRFCASDGFSVVNWQRSIALTRSFAVVGTTSPSGLQSGACMLSIVVGSQSSSTPLPLYSNAPGFTAEGSGQSAIVSQQSPWLGVHPSPS